MTHEKVYGICENLCKVEVMPSINLVGAILQYAGKTAPEGFLLCDGQAVSRTTYAALFKIIGSTYGSGNGSTTFNVPNLKGRVPVGVDSNDSDFNTLGKTGGAKSVTLTKEQIPAHNHSATVSINSGGAHTHSASSNSTGAHSHSVSGKATSGGSHIHKIKITKTTNETPAQWGLVTGSVGFGGRVMVDGDVEPIRTTESAGAHTHSVSGTASSNGSHSHTITVNSGGGHSHTGTVSVANSGGGQAHNNLQPYIILNYIIKY